MKVDHLGLILCLCALIFTACGSDSDDVRARVINSSLSERVLQVGQGTVLTLGLEYENSIQLPFESSEDISLVVKIPAGLTYREGTAEIQRVVDDKGVNPRIENCLLNGEQFLYFRLDGDDLDQGRDPSGSADVEITLTLDAVAARGIGVIEAAADRDTPLFDCGSFFASDIEESIQVN